MYGLLQLQMWICRSGSKKESLEKTLYFRLNTVPIHVPSLRERPEDIYMLFRKFAVDFAEKYRTPPIQLDDKGQFIARKLFLARKYS